MQRELVTWLHLDKLGLDKNLRRLLYNKYLDPITKIMVRCAHNSNLDASVLIQQNSWKLVKYCARNGYYNVLTWAHSIYPDILRCRHPEIGKCKSNKFVLLCIKYDSFDILSWAMRVDEVSKCLTELLVRGYKNGYTYSDAIKYKRLNIIELLRSKQLIWTIEIFAQAISEGNDAIIDYMFENRNKCFCGKESGGLFRDCDEHLDGSLFTCDVGLHGKDENHGEGFDIRCRDCQEFKDSYIEETTTYTYRMHLCAIYYASINQRSCKWINYFKELNINIPPLHEIVFVLSDCGFLQDIIKIYDNDRELFIRDFRDIVYCAAIIGRSINVLEWAHANFIDKDNIPDDSLWSLMCIRDAEGNRYKTERRFETIKWLLIKGVSFESYGGIEIKSNAPETEVKFFMNFIALLDPESSIEWAIEQKVSNPDSDTANKILSFYDKNKIKIIRTFGKPFLHKIFKHNKQQHMRVIITTGILNYVTYLTICEMYKIDPAQYSRFFLDEAEPVDKKIKF